MTAAAAWLRSSGGKSRDSPGRRSRIRMGKASVLVAGVSLSILATCDAFQFASPHQGSMKTATRAGYGYSPVSSRSAALGVRSAGWIGSGGALTGISKAVMKRGRCRRWRDGSSSSSSSRTDLAEVRMMGSALEASGFGDALTVPDERILKAVEKAGNRAVPSDVAALAGVDLNTAKRGMVTLANLVGGDLEVSKDGDVVYNFPSNFRASLLSKSAYRRAVEAARKAWPVIFYGIRVSFGVVLLSSIALIFSTIFFAATYANSSSEDDRGGRRRGGGFDNGGFGGGRGMGFNTFFGPSPFDFFFYRPYYGYYGTPVPRGGRRGDPEEMGLLESVFSFIFGDGDPNADMDQRRLEAAAALIRGNGGAVSAEQLAPLLTPGNPRPDDSSLVDESFVLPILTALDGAPEVTADGDIVYVFPTLQTSAMVAGSPALSGGMDQKETRRLQGLKSLSTGDLRIALEAVGIRAMSIFERSELIDAAMSAGIAKLDNGTIVQEALPTRSSSTSPRPSSASSRRGIDIPEPLQEAQRPFSVAAPWKKVAAGVLGAVNLGGALYLQGLLSQPVFAGVTLPGYYGFVQGALPFLLTYAVALNVIPAVRWLLNKRENAKIEERNFLRQKWADFARGGGPVVQRKLKAAKTMTTDMKVIKAEDVEYTTAKPLAEQAGGQDDDLLDDFDARLKSLKK